MVYKIYSEGREVGSASRWKTVMKQVNTQRNLGKSGQVLEEFPNRLRADLRVLEF